MHKHIMRALLFLWPLVVLVNSGCEEHQSTTVIVDRPVKISAEWVTLPFPHPLVATALWAQDVLVSVSSSHERNAQPLSLRMPDGTLVAPDVEVLTSDGLWLPLHMGFYGEDASFSSTAFSGDGNTFVAVRLKSARPIMVSRVEWDSYDPREVKR
jgi:hypothetical protein